MTAGGADLGSGDAGAASARSAGAAREPGRGASEPGGAAGRSCSVLTEIDHVAIAVADLDAAVAWYETMFGATVAHRERIESDGVEEALLKVADSYIQLLTPVTPDSPVARYLERHGEGLHHIGYRVADVASALETLKAQGARVIDAVPRPGSRGTTVAFVHPKASFGTLIELVQE
ncbi:MAG: methylmalonyl-CoA/ethylmalonyl-CoA epimerase [Acidimicrobiaceae bacterium]|nr:methylmalonyl-CoA/ethylmalonyl-CoA epimerase [Acidimicrobiaceae bacterium]